MEKVKKQYGLWTGIAMVVGIVIGSGVFFKADEVLAESGGDLGLSLLAWFVGGIIMITSGFCFAIFANKVTKYNGVVDYIETATNKKIGYGLAWLVTTFYYPIIASIVSIMASRYFFVLCGYPEFFDPGATGVSWQIFLFAFIILTLFVALNYFSPKLASVFQISSTAIKLIPIVVIAVAGLFASVIVEDGGIINAFMNSATYKTNDVGEKVELIANFGNAVKATAFAYEGWVCATSINAELKDSKKQLPKALVGGTIAILAFYLIYFISLSAFIGNQGIMNSGDEAPIKVFTELLGRFGGSIFTVFIIISCLGTVNGVSMSCCRGMYTMSCRGQGIMPEKFSKLGSNQSVSLLSCVYGYVCMLLMLGVWALALNGVSFFSYLGSMDEIICAIIYGAYITMYIYIIRNFKDCNIFQRFIMPIIAIIGSLFFVLCGTGLFQFISTGSTSALVSFGVFMILFAIFMFPCLFFYKKDAKEIVDENSKLI